MSASPAVQAAKKRMQLARLEAKANDLDNYPEFYAKQPTQIERARLFKIYKEQQQKLREADEALEIAAITGEGLEEAQKEQAIATLVVERARPDKRSMGAHVGLTASGSGGVS